VHVRSITAGEYAENEIRKDFTPSERVAIGKALEAEVGDRRGQRTHRQVLEHVPEPGPTSSSCPLVENVPQVKPGVKTRDIVAKAAGFGNARTYEQAKKVVHQGAPDLVEAMDSGEVSISAAAVIAAEPRERQEQIVQLPGELRRQTVRELRGATNLPTPGDARRLAGETGTSVAVTLGIQAAVETESAPGQVESTSKGLKSANRGRTADVAKPGRAPAAPQAPASAAPVRTTRSQRIDRLARLTLSFIEATKHLAHLVGWLGETAGKFDEAELLLSNAGNAIAAVSAEIERTALAADPLNASRLGIQEKTS
jgi:ParB family chromosome partitioning protein